jgi:hypothetical protein
MRNWMRFWKGRSTWQVLLAAGVIGLLAAPWAVASGAGGLVGAQRNPSSDPASSYHRETQIIGDVAQGQGGFAKGTGGFVTRQSNKSDSGGGAVYGCRAKAGTNPCVEAVNLSTGHAFEFLTGTGADAAGRILVGADASKTVDKPPFVTNATGVVQNLNADMVGGKHAADLVNTGQLLFATVDAAGKLGATRGATAASFSLTPGAPGAPGVPTYTVTFTPDLAKCAYTATPTAVAAGTVAAAPGALGPGAEVHKVVITESATATGFSLQVTC